MRTIILLFVDYNCNIFFLDYLFNSLKNNIINILKNKFNLKIYLFTSNYENYDKIPCLNNNVQTDTILSKLKELNIDDIKIYYNCFLKNKEEYYKNSYEINKIICNKLKNDIFEYIFFIPPNSYKYEKINIEVFNNNILYDKLSNSFILPTKFKKELINIEISNDKLSNSFILPTKFQEELIYLLENKHNNIRGIEYSNLFYIHIHDKIEFNKSLFYKNKETNTDIIKQIIGLPKHIIINDFNFLKENKDILCNIDKYIINLNPTKEYNKYNLNNNSTKNNIAFIIIGQVRTFIYPKIYNSLKKEYIRKK